MKREEMIDRCIEIEDEYDSLQNIHLTDEDIEDVSDRYQEKLELQWHKQELEDEYKALNAELGLIKRSLYDRSLIRSRNLQDSDTWNYRTSQM